MEEELFRSCVHGVGWVALERWRDGLKLRVRGYYVYEEQKPEPPTKQRPVLKLVD